MFKRVYTVFALLAMVGCNGAGGSIESTSDYPKTWEERQQEQMGKLSGPEGIVLFGGKSKSSAATEGISVNSYLWRATLDTIYKMPLISADPFSGVVITDWYRANDRANERFKFNIYIIGNELRSDAVRVTVFKQLLNKQGAWADSLNNDAMASEIENKILLKARAIKYKSK